MSSDGFGAKALRFTGIVLMGLTAGFTLLGGVGTSCVAFNPTGFGEKMASLASVQWLYIIFVAVGILLGVLGIRATARLVRGAQKSYQEALILLLAGAVVGIGHIVISRALRGGSMPVDVVVYATMLTLAVFLLFRIPGIWQGVDFSRSRASQNKPAGGAAAILVGLMALTMQYSMAASHTWDGVNYAAAFNAILITLGVVLIAFGAMLLVQPRLPRALRARLAFRGSPQ